MPLCWLRSILQYTEYGQYPPQSPQGSTYWAKINTGSCPEKKSANIPGQCLFVPSFTGLQPVVVLRLVCKLNLQGGKHKRYPCPWRMPNLAKILFFSTVFPGFAVDLRDYFLSRRLSWTYNNKSVWYRVSGRTEEKYRQAIDT